MKILLTVHQFFPDFAAGTEVLTYSVARELVDRGHEVRVLSGHPGKRGLPEGARFEEYDYKGIRVYRYHHAFDQAVERGSKMELDFDNHTAANFFGRILDEYVPDIVHFFHLSRLGTGLIVKTAERGIPASMTPTDFWSVCPKARMSYADGKECLGPSPNAGNCAVHLAAQTFGVLAERLVTLIPASVGDFLVRSVRIEPMSSIRSFNEVKALSERLPTNISRLNLLKKLVVPNRTLEDVLLRHGVDADKIVCSAYGIDFDELDVLNAQKVPGSILQIGFIGTLASHKGCHVLLKAFQRLDKGTACLKIYGSESNFSEYADELRRCSEESSDVEFCGTFPNSEIGRVLGNLDVLVVPSIWTENTPLVIYSAQAAACPVLASDVPGIAEVIEHNVNGLLFERGNVTSLYECLAELAKTPSILERLSRSSTRPKTTVAYVDELLDIWSA